MIANAKFQVEPDLSRVGLRRFCVIDGPKYFYTKQDNSIAIEVIKAIHDLFVTGILHIVN